MCRCYESMKNLLFILGVFVIVTIHVSESCPAVVQGKIDFEWIHGRENKFHVQCTALLTPWYSHNSEFVQLFCSFFIFPVTRFLFKDLLYIATFFLYLWYL